MVDIYFQGIDMNYYFKFKTSMISQLNVDYTPNGIAINKGGRPSAIRITMTLNEAYIHTADDYDVSEQTTQLTPSPETVAPESQEGVTPTTGTSDGVDTTGDGTPSTSALGNGENDPNVKVPAPNGQSDAVTPNSTKLADEYSCLLYTSPSPRD